MGGLNLTFMQLTYTKKYFETFQDVVKIRKGLQRNKINKFVQNKEVSHSKELFFLSKHSATVVHHKQLT